VLGDQGAEVVQQLQQEGELLVAVAGRELGGPFQEVVEEAEGLVGPVLGGLDEDAAAVAGVGLAVDVAGAFQPVDGGGGGPAGEPDGGGELAAG
jgi:hypothetical protein